MTFDGLVGTIYAEPLFLTVLATLGREGPLALFAVEGSEPGPFGRTGLGWLRVLRFCGGGRRLGFGGRFPAVLGFGLCSWFRHVVRVDRHIQVELVLEGVPSHPLVQGNLVPAAFADTLTDVQWWSPSHLRDLPEIRPVDRVRWYQLHEDRLNGLVRGLVLAFEFVALTPVDQWDDRWGRRLVSISDAITQEYAYGNPTYWQLASRTIRCESALELAMSGGIGTSCPSGDFQRALDQAYVASGEIVARLRRIGHAAQLPYDHQVGGLYSDTSVATYQEESLAEVQRLMSDLVPIFEDLRVYGEAHGHYLDVRLP